MAERKYKNKARPYLREKALLRHGNVPSLHLLFFITLLEIFEQLPNLLEFLFLSKKGKMLLSMWHKNQFLFV